MRAVVHDRYGPPRVLRVAEVERPLPADDEVLVRVRATTVTRTDCHVRRASPFMWLTLRGYSFSNAGENLAAGFETAEVLVQSWMESPGHRRNILAPQFHDVGIAVIEGAVARRATGRSVVVLFARERQ